MKSRIAFFYIILFVGLVQNSIIAQRVHQLSIGTHSFTYDQITSKWGVVSSSIIKDTCYRPQVYSESGLLSGSDRGRLKTIESALVIGMLKDSIQETEDFTARAVLKVYSKKFNSTRLDSQRISLSVDYKNAKRQNYKAKDYIRIDSVAWAVVQLDSIISDKHYSRLSQRPFVIEFQILGREFITASLNDPIQIRIKNLDSLNVESKGNFLMKWDQPPLWAQSFDVEWQFTDGYSSQTPEFLNNSTRINVPITTVSYSVPIIAARGKFRCRIRAVGLNENGHVVNGRWSSIAEIGIPNQQAFEKNRKPWQYAATYFDEGKRKDIVSFADGTGRTRQTNTRLNSGPKHVMVQEDYYDHQGRPVVKSSVAPFQKPDRASANNSRTSRNEPFGGIDSRFIPPGINTNIGNASTIGAQHGFNELYNLLTATSDLSYKDKFNRDQYGKIFDRKSFDLDRGDCGTEFKSLPMGNNSGAGKYFSPNQSIEPLDKHSEFIPDAEGFPYTQVEYTPDNTGRIRSQGLAGKDFQLGSGHEIKYFYSIPTQQELYRVFGHEIGNASKYTKRIIKDPNGQLQVQYLNSNSKVIASALMGDAPTSLQSLPAEEVGTPITETINLMDYGNWSEESGSKSVSSATLFFELPTNNIQINYSLDPVEIRETICRQNICTNCPRTLKIRIMSSCGDTVFSSSQKVLGIDNCNELTGSRSPVVSINRNITLAQGEYTITKTLELDENAVSTFINEYIKRDTSCYQPTVPQAICIETEQCIPCTFSVSRLGEVTRESGNNLNCKRNCHNGTYKFDIRLFETLCRDVSPMGQYGSIRDTDRIYLVSVFNPSNVLHPISIGGTRFIRSKWYRDQSIIYLNESGEREWLDATHMDPRFYDNREDDMLRTEVDKVWITPNKITDLEYLSTIWKDCWSESLVHLHPEYKYLLWNNMNYSSIQFDQRLQSCDKWDQALEQSLVDPSENRVEMTFDADPFYNAVPASVKEYAISKMSTMIINRYITGNIYSLIKATISCNAPLFQDNRDEMSSCIAAAPAIRSYIPEGKEFAMNMFKSFYLSTKYRILDSIREVQLSTGSGHELSSLASFRCLGSKDRTSCSPCIGSAMSIIDSILSERMLRVAHTRCINLNSIPNPSLPASPFNDREITMNEIRLSKLTQCRITPKAEDFKNLINAICFSDANPEKLFSTRMKLNAIPPLVLLPSLTENFPNRRSRNYYWKASSAIDHLKVEILDDVNQVQASFKMTSRDFPKKLNNLMRINCISMEFIDTSARYAKTKLHMTGMSSIGPVSITVYDFVNLNFTYQTIVAELNRFRLEVGNDVYKKLASNKKNLTGLCCINETYPTTKPIFPCELSIPRLNQANLISDKRARAEFLYDSLYTKVIERCMNPALERFTLTKQTKIYHYTLFYYDLAGALVKTVSPKGVRTLSGEPTATRSRTNFPPHIEELSTKYTYNSLGEKLSTLSPDGGLTTWCYDEVGRPIISQDAAQRSNGTMSYVLYDRLGRTVEGGFIEGGLPRASSFFDKGYITYVRFADLISERESRKIEIKRTYYDKPFFTNIESKFTRNNYRRFCKNRVVSAVSYADFNAMNSQDYIHAGHFNYDISGNVIEYISDFKALVSSSLLSRENAEIHRFKKIDYKFYPFSGQISEIAYQAGNADQFYQWYQYNEDGKMISMKSGSSRYEPEIRLDCDMKNTFYSHGMLARAEVGPENNQAMDYTYTINGWIKSLNKFSGINIGKDGETGSAFPADLLSFEFKYFQNDYKPVRPDGAFAPSSLITNLYNENLSEILVENADFGDRNVLNYRYDQLNRLTSSRRNSGNNYSMDLTYDPNGNIKSLLRKGSTGNVIDNMNYQYQNTNSNKLDHIQDPAGEHTVSGITDFATQTAGNYQYDLKGRLTADRSENHILQWSNSDKLKRLNKSGETINFHYDHLDRRILKSNPGNQGEYTIRDSKGNILSEYRIIDGRIRILSLPIYDGQRIGENKVDTTLIGTEDLRRWNQYRGQKVYELKNQVGDVNILFSDRKINDITGPIPDVRKNTEYYPFGMTVPGRDSSYTDYRYGFQGMEQDDNFKGTGNSVSTEFRQYDPRVARWLSVDPMEVKYPGVSPFVAFNNNPINLIDPKGDDPPPSILRLSFIDHDGNTVRNQTSRNRHEERTRVVTSAVITLIFEERVLNEHNVYETRLVRQRLDITLSIANDGQADLEFFNSPDRTLVRYEVDLTFNDERIDRAAAARADGAFPYTAEQRQRHINGIVPLEFPNRMAGMTTHQEITQVEATTETDQGANERIGNVIDDVGDILRNTLLASLFGTSDRQIINGSPSATTRSQEPSGERRRTVRRTPQRIEQCVE